MIPDEFRVGNIFFKYDWEKQDLFIGRNDEIGAVLGDVTQDEYQELYEALG